MRYRKIPVEIDAHPWNKNGDHPLDGDPDTEGNLVRYFRHPSRSGLCKICNRNYQDHGWIDTLEGGHIVCPGDMIIEGVNGEFYPCKPDIFAKTYEAV
jgi:hypothetical protein